MPPRLQLLLALATCVTALTGCGDLPAAPSPAELRVQAWHADVVPVLQQHCVGCHGGAEPMGSLDLDPFVAAGDPPDEAALRTQAGLAEKLAGHVAGGLMPPPGEVRPDPEAARAFSAWWTKHLEQAWAAAPPDPGRVTMRRLNRYEYRRTVRDLVGVDFPAEEIFPTDDVGYGFDHIGDVLSMPPILFEKYLDAAARIAEEAIWDYDPRTPRRLEAERLRISRGGRAVGERVLMTSDGSVLAPLEIGRGGRYAVRVRAWADLMNETPAWLELGLRGRKLAKHHVFARAREPAVFESILKLTRGPHELAVAFTNDDWDPRNPDPRKRDRNLHIDWIEIQGPLADGRTPLPPAQQRLVPCDPEVGEERSCAQEILRGLLRRAWRRPPTDVELERHVGLVMQAMADGESFRGALRLALQAVLVSPHFLFRVELDERSGPGTRSAPLDEHALASRLAYFLWSSLPDDELAAHADAGTLRTALHDQVTRMLAHPRAAALVENFGAQWLELRRLDTVAPDPGRFDTFDEKLRKSMRRETELVLAALIREDRSILDLIDWPYTYVDPLLARHYGLEGVTGKGFRRVKLTDERRGGLLGHASILTLTSYPTRTSPVQRGKWLMEEILGTPPAPPPPGVGTLETQDPALLKLSLRERLQQHREDPSCAVCHDRMDNLGYGLEAYDPVGRWRRVDGDVEIDASGVLPDGRAFDGPAELRAILRDDPGFPRCFAEKLLTYALGRGLEPYDRPAVLKIVDEARQKGLRFSSFVHAIVASEPFTMRRTSGEPR
ncbi:MAG: DUF1592 domain-containing protein [Planctomycetota bacterium]|nr:DUF1592 domain-containing protein [Planctomycetota bacterium]